MLALMAVVERSLEEYTLSIAKTAHKRRVPGLRVNAMRRHPSSIEERFCVTLSTIAQETDNAAARPCGAHSGGEF